MQMVADFFANRFVVPGIYRGVGIWGRCCCCWAPTAAGSGQRDSRGGRGDIIMISRIHLPGATGDPCSPSRLSVVASPTGFNKINKYKSSLLASPEWNNCGLIKCLKRGNEMVIKPCAAHISDTSTLIRTPSSLLPSGLKCQHLLGL